MEEAREWHTPPQMPLLQILVSFTDDWRGFHARSCGDVCLCDRHKCVTEELNPLLVIAGIQLRLVGLMVECCPWVCILPIWAQIYP